MLQLLGHLHPVLVHLPIGILLLACLFMWQARKDRFEHLQPVINIILFWGMISAICSCITGYILSQTGDYDPDLVSFHQWMGITVAVVSIAIFYLRRQPDFLRWQPVVAIVLLFLLLVTGHLGGSLTHGSNYLTQPLETLLEGDSAVAARKPIANIQEAIAYDDVIEPILADHCYSCHGPSKQKGKLRMDVQDQLMKGGKDGVVIIAGKANESELIKRILLPKDDDHHMAPREKPQLNAAQVSLITWWIANGASFTKKVAEIAQTPNENLLLSSLQSNAGLHDSIPDVPPMPVEQAKESDIQKLKDRGIVVLPVAQNSNYLQVNFVTATHISNNSMRLLLPLKEQIIWLKAGDLAIGDSAMHTIAQCRHLLKLQLNHTLITDSGVSQLASLTQLQSLNLGSTKVTVNGIKQLAKMKSLRHIYLYQITANKDDWQQLIALFPKNVIDSGGYQVPTFETDTTIVKETKK